MLREVTLEQVVDAIPALREAGVSDRAILRAIHFERDNARVADQVADLERGDFKAFLSGTSLSVGGQRSELPMKPSAFFRPSSILSSCSLFSSISLLNEPIFLS